jgi:hypothetical protein
VATDRGRERQSGQELIEFALTSLLLVVLFVGAFVTGMSLIRSIQVHQACRDMAGMYIHGADFSTYAMQQLAQRLARGPNLQIGSSFSGNSATNTSNSGNALVTVSEIMYIGPTTSPTCAAVGASQCTNHDSYVFLQRILFGNGTLAAQHPSSLGNPTTSAISSAGVVQNPITDAGAKLSGAAQTSLGSLWLVPWQDGQVSYVVELYAQSPELSMGSFTSAGAYARYFF